MHWMFKSWDCVNFVTLTAKWTITNTHLLDNLLVIHVVIVQGLINVKKKKKLHILFHWDIFSFLPSILVFQLTAIAASLSHS